MKIITKIFLFSLFFTMGCSNQWYYSFGDVITTNADKTILDKIQSQLHSDIVCKGLDGNVVENKQIKTKATGRSDNDNSGETALVKHTYEFTTADGIEGKCEYYKIKRQPVIIINTSKNTELIEKMHKVIVKILINNGVKEKANL